MSSSSRRTILLLFAVALAVRLVAAIVLGAGGPLTEDEIGYARIARSVAAGDGFALPIADRVADAVPPRTAFRAPGLPLLLAPLAAVDAGPLALRLVSLLLGALGAPLLWLALRSGPLAARGALAAAGAYALWPPAVYLSLRVLSEPLSQALLLAALVLWAGRGGRAPRPQTSCGAGALAALAVLTRPALVPAAALLGVTRGRRGLLWFGVAATVVAAPWLVRNALLHGRPLLTTNAGVTLVGANSPAAASAPVPGKWLPPDEVYAHEPAAAPDLGMWGWSALGEARSDAAFRAAALEFVRERPGAALRLAGWKLVRLFDPDPRSRKADAGGKRLIGWLTLAPVLLLAAVGSVRLVRDPLARRGLRPWGALVAGTVATAVVFYGDARMRTAADPALLVLAAGALFGPGAGPAPATGARAVGGAPAVPSSGTAAGG